MKWVTDFTTRDGLNFEIDREAVTGPKAEKEFHRFTLRAFDTKGNIVTEFLQEDLIEAQMRAMKKWGVPLAAWELHL
jgi:hypothetical protein